MLRNNYEVVFVVSKKLDLPLAQQMVGELVKVVEPQELTTKLLEIDTLAYPINNQKFCYFFVTNFQSASNQINQLSRLARINKNILRYLIINTDKNYGARALANPKKVKLAENRAKRYEEIRLQAELDAKNGTTATQSSNYQSAQRSYSQQQTGKSRVCDRYRKVGTYLKNEEGEVIFEQAVRFAKRNWRDRSNIGAVSAGSEERSVTEAGSAPIKAVNLSESVPDNTVKEENVVGATAQKSQSGDFVDGETSPVISDETANQRDHVSKLVSHEGNQTEFDNEQDSGHVSENKGKDSASEDTEKESSFVHHESAHESTMVETKKESNVSTAIHEERIAHREEVSTPQHKTHSPSQNPTHGKDHVDVAPSPESERKIEVVHSEDISVSRKHVGSSTSQKDLPATSHSKKSVTVTRSESDLSSRSKSAELVDKKRLGGEKAKEVVAVRAKSSSGVLSHSKSVATAGKKQVVAGKGATSTSVKTKATKSVLDKKVKSDVTASKSKSVSKISKSVEGKVSKSSEKPKTSLLSKTVEAKKSATSAKSKSSRSVSSVKKSLLPDVKKLATVAKPATVTKSASKKTVKSPTTKVVSTSKVKAVKSAGDAVKKVSTTKEKKSTSLKTSATKTAKQKAVKESSKKVTKSALKKKK